MTTAATRIRMMPPTTTTTVVATVVVAVVTTPPLLHRWRGKGTGKTTRARSIRHLSVTLMRGGTRLWELLRRTVRPSLTPTSAVVATIVVVVAVATCGGVSTVKEEKGV